MSAQGDPVGRGGRPQRVPRHAKPQDVAFFLADDAEDDIDPADIDISGYLVPDVPENQPSLFDGVGEGRP